MKEGQQPDIKIIIGTDPRIDDSAKIGYYPGKEKFSGWKKVTTGEVRIGKNV